VELQDRVFWMLEVFMGLECNKKSSWKKISLLVINYEDVSSGSGNI